MHASVGPQYHVICQSIPRPKTLDAHIGYALPAGFSTAITWLHQLGVAPAQAHIKSRGPSSLSGSPAYHAPRLALRIAGLGQHRLDGHP